MPRWIAVLALTLAALCRAQLPPNPNACQAVLVTPCLVATSTGIVTITSPSQLTFQIGANGFGSSNGGNAIGRYTDANGNLPADPNGFIQQDAAAAAALIASGAP